MMIQAHGASSDGDGGERHEGDAHIDPAHLESILWSPKHFCMQYLSEKNWRYLLFPFYEETEAQNDDEPEGQRV